MSDNCPTASIARLVSGEHLSREETTSLFRKIVAGELNDIQIAAAVSALKVRGESVDELAGAATALIESATNFVRPDYAFADVVGTGGDGHNTINLSTIAAITAAACGAKIVKHGNRSISSCSGSFDFLDTMGLKLDATPEVSRNLLDDHGICFLFAPAYHSGMRHAANVRKTLGVRSVFNLLGPLVNPSRPPYMLLGVAQPELMQPVADVLQQLGTESAFVVHGSGVDEVAIHGPTQIIGIRGNRQETIELVPSDFGANTYPLQDLVCHDAAESHQRSQAALAGKGTEAESAAIAVNSALVLKLFGNDDLAANFEQSMTAMQTGKAAEMLSNVVEGSQQ